VMTYARITSAAEYRRGKPQCLHLQQILWAPRRRRKRAESVEIFTIKRNVMLFSLFCFCEHAFSLLGI
jgi:hypothetical protein